MDGSRSQYRKKKTSSKASSSLAESSAPHGEGERNDSHADATKMRIGYLLDGTSSGSAGSSSATRGSMPRSASAWNIGDLKKMSIGSILNSSRGPNNLPASSSSRSRQSRYTCTSPQCGAQFSLFSEIKHHRATAHGLESHQCIYCKTVLAREANLMYHVNSKHKKAGEHWCYKCSFKTHDLQTLRKHTESVHAMRKCGTCGERILKSNQAQHRAKCHSMNPQESRGKRGRR